MKVYRLCSEEEYESMMNTKSYESIGKECKKNRMLSNHQYQPDQKYLHFFKDFASIFYFYVREGTYVCTYDIPDGLLKQYEGIGKYLDRINMRNYDYVTEYAIPNKEMDFSYLSKIDKATRTIEFEEILFDEHIDGLETVYDREQKPDIITDSDENYAGKK